MTDLLVDNAVETLPHAQQLAQEQREKQQRDHLAAELAALAAAAAGRERKLGSCASSPPPPVDCADHTAVELKLRICMWFFISPVQLSIGIFKLETGARWSQPQRRGRFVDAHARPGWRRLRAAFVRDQGQLSAATSLGTVDHVTERVATERVVVRGQSH
jgi:hypothetical protein